MSASGPLELCWVPSAAFLSGQSLALCELETGNLLPFSPSGVPRGVLETVGAQCTFTKLNFRDKGPRTQVWEWVCTGTCL